MRRVRLGTTGVEVSAVALGTWSYGGEKRVDGRAVGWSGHDDERALGALERAFEVGIDHWDTADVYGEGEAERLIGRVWERVPRERVFLATKVGWNPGPYGHAYDPRQIRERLERSLTLLATERVDLHYFHRCEFGPGDRYLEPAVETFRALRDEGKLRFIGLSDWDPDLVERYAPAVEPDVVQPYRNVLDDGYRTSGLARWVAERGAGAAFFSPLKHGLLLGKYREAPEFGPGDMRSGIPEFGDPRALAHFRRCREAVERRFAGHPQPLLHALVGALLADSPTACALLGLRDRAQVDAAAAIGEPLSAEDAAWVRELYRQESPEPPRGV